MLLLILSAVAVAAIFYYYVFKPLNYWKDRGVEQGDPKWLFGHFWDTIIGRKNGCEMFDAVYKQSPNARYTGMYRFSKPILVVRDPELIKQITVKDFDSFTDHPEVLPPEADPLWSKNLLNLTGSKWRDTRMLLSPSFTSSKMRTIFLLMTDCAENLIQHLLQKDADTSTPNMGSEKMMTIDLKDLFSRYTNDVIATSAFGVKVDSLSEPQNEFYEVSNDVSDISNFWRTMKLLLYWLIPPVKNFMKIQFIPDEAGTFFRGLIDDTLKIREERGIVRPDMLHLLLQTRNDLRKQQENGSNTSSKKNLDLSNEDITAHAAIFIIAGFESVSSFICFTAYELAVNPDIQKRLRKEVLFTKEKCGGKVTYEAILDMKYMDMVLSESIRKWPHFLAIDRKCTKPYTIDPVTPNEVPVHLNEGMELIIPVFSIQHDSKNFPDPERFDPERFSDENKGDIDPYTYLSFGVGPRTCIGSRFALLETKILLFHLLCQFEIVPVKKTSIPLKFQKDTIINLRPVGGFWLGFKKYEE